MRDDDGRPAAPAPLLNPGRFTPLHSLERKDRNRVRHLIHTAGDDAIVRSGAAIKFGRDWYIDREKFPEALRQRFLELHESAQPAVKSRRPNGSRRARRRVEDVHGGDAP